MGTTRKGCINMDYGRRHTSTNTFVSGYATSRVRPICVDLVRLVRDKPDGTKPKQTYTLDPASHYFAAARCHRHADRRLLPTWSVGFRNANLHINIPLDACDDMVYTYAWTCRDHFPAGRRSMWSGANEPWELVPTIPGQSTIVSIWPLGHAAVARIPTRLPTIAYRATQMPQIFRDVFTAAGGRGDRGQS